MGEKLSVLVVDDEQLVRETTALQLRSAGYDADEAESAAAALELLKTRRWDVVLTDLRMPSMSGLEFLRELKRRAPEVEVIVMTGFGSVETAVEAMQVGATDYLTKPFSFRDLDARLDKIAELRSVRSELARLKQALDTDRSTCGLTVRSPAMRRVWERIELFAQQDSPVLVIGETGTGKELVAKALHQLSGRKSGPFVPVASGAIPQSLAESELFGHEKGSFTGAVARRKGSFERADGGTLLLDDVDDLPPEIQVKLLRVLQEGTLQRVGAARETSVDVRIVATTKVDLLGAVGEGRFREDLFYRLRGLELRLPPLRQRHEELLVLTRIFLRRLAARDDTPPKTLSTPAAEALQQHSWPGNVRELKRVVESAVVLCRGAEIGPEHLPEYLRADPRPDQPFTLRLERASRLSFQDLVSRFEDELIDWALRKADGRQTAAAKLLDLPRTTLQAKLGRRRS